MIRISCVTSRTCNFFCNDANGQVTNKEMKPSKHHLQSNPCETRAKYRQGRKDTAVKVYTVSQESKYLLIQGVPSVGVRVELENLCAKFGIVDSISILEDYPSEEFTETYLVKYQRFLSARAFKRREDAQSFFGGVLHICYAPEFETVQDTREKLAGRRRYIESQTWQGSYVHNRYPQPHSSAPTEETPIPALPSSSSCSTYIWAGKEYPVNELVQPIPLLNEDKRSSVKQSSQLSKSMVPLLPRQLMSSVKRQDVEKRPQDVVDYQDTTAALVRSHLTKVAMPGLEVSLKRRKT